jgi:mannitol/fructose-specific phosphotransferase system IIA component (Ntr-type)
MIENKDRYYAQIIHRESLENTSIGNGFAIPHARTDTVTKFISIFGIHADGIDYQSIDGKPVKYIMLSIFPTSMSTRYLYLVGMTARIFSNKEKLALIDEAKTPSKIHAIMKKESNIYFDSISQKETDDFQKPVNLTGIPSSELDILIRIDRLYNLLEESTDKAEIQKKIDAMRSLIDNRSLTYYERMKKKRDNPFSIVEKDSCSGCHMSIPPIYRKEVHDGNQLMVCTHCGRFLIVV